jgi:glycosyltransferase involved in cell wall biosynthesis
VRLRIVVPPDVESVTGGNVYDLALARALEAAGHQVDVVSCARSGLVVLLRRSGPETTLVDGLLACSEPDAIAGAAVGVLVHMPLAWEAGSTPGRAGEVDEREGRALRAASVVIATSHWSAGYLRRRHGIRQVAVAAPGVEAAPIATGSDPPLLVHVAALSPTKDQLNVVAALRKLAHRAWRARLVGANDRYPGYAESVVDAVSTAGLSKRIEIPGVLKRDNAWDGADLALLPSRAESFGLAVTEALARGVPAVVTEGGAAEALGLTSDGRRPGIVVPPGDEAALARALGRWLDDRDCRDELRSRAIERRLTLDGWDETARIVQRALTPS